jgi:hypothetical protein
MLGCMESLGAYYKSVKEDYEYEFYENYLMSFKELDESLKLVKVTDDLKVIFVGFERHYDVSKTIPATSRKPLDKCADSFAFYIAVGVIIKDNDDYYIDLKKLNECTKYYENFNNELGTSKKIGGRK